MTNEDRARSAASDWCRCSKCDGIARNILKVGLRCDKYKLHTCRKFYDGYNAALIALNQLTNNNIMEYKKDVRTKNLTLRDIHVGDWVQVWSEITERYSPPLKIIQICADGTIYLVTSDEERPTPWEENIKNVDTLPITPDLLKGFGFEVVEQWNPSVAKAIAEWPLFLQEEIKEWSVSMIYYNEKPIGYIKIRPELYFYVFCSHADKIYTRYAHELFHELITKEVLENVSFEWKGLDKQT